MARRKSGEDGEENVILKYRLMPIANELLKQGWTSYKAIVAEYGNRYSDEAVISELYNQTNNDCYRALQAVIREIDKDLKKMGFKDGLERVGSKRSQQMKFPEGIENLDKKIVEMEKKQKRMRQKQLLRLIETSVGLFPGSWMADFAKEIHKMMEDEEKTHRKIISFDTNEKLIGLNLIPEIYDAIENEMVLKITYDARFVYKQEAIFHPHFIKEYNNRFFVFGKAIIKKEGSEVPDIRPICNYALDRISSIEIVTGVDYEKPDEKFDFEEYFKPIIGVTRTRKKRKDGSYIDFGEREITIQTLNLYTHQRLMTKPLHHTQEQVRAFGANGRDFGIIKLKVIPNPELQGRLLEFGSNICVLQTEKGMSFYNSFSREVARLARLYPELPPEKKEKLE
jgi:hypothetical protein